MGASNTPPEAAVWPITQNSTEQGVLDDVGEVAVRMAPAPFLGPVPLAARPTPSGIDIAEVDLPVLLHWLLLFLSSS